MTEWEVQRGAYERRPRCKPDNCIKVGEKSVEKEPYEAAKDFIKINREHYCCNVGMDKSVQRWELPEGVPGVHLKKSSTDTTFFYNHDLPIVNQA